MWFQPIKNNIMHPIKKTVSIILLSLSLLTINLKAQSTIELNIWIDSLLNKYVTESGIVGIGASVIYKDSVVFSNGFGYMDLENKIVALQVKSGVWGLLAGLLGVVIAWIVKGQMGM